MKLIPLLAIIVILSCVGCAYGETLLESEKILERRYTDWAGCMAICTPGCAITNCNQWCVRVCCGQFPSYYQC